MHHDYFFETDHHWKPHMGMSAAGSLAKYLNATFAYQLDLSAFQLENYKEKIYKNYFLGSLGKKLTLAKVTRDDISFYFPKFKTKLKMEIPSIGLEKSGDFSVIYDQERIDPDYMLANPYGAYNYGDKPFVRIHNELADNQKKLLIIRDSFSNVMIPFLSLSVSDILALDLRQFNGSVQSCIEKEKPDIVLVAYYTDILAEWREDWIFDFR